MIIHINDFFVTLRVMNAAEMALERRLAQQTTLVRGQNLQMLDFAELGRPSARAHLAHPILARVMPSSRAVSRALTVSRWIGAATAWSLAILVGIVAAAALSHFTPS